MIMKTAEEILKEKTGHAIGLMDYKVIEAMKEYAKEAAKQALANASKCFLGSSSFARDVRESILNENNIPEL